MLQTAAEVDRSVDDVEENGIHVVWRFSHDPVLHRRHFGDAVAEIARDRGGVIGCGPHRDANPFSVGLQGVEAVAPHERHRIRELMVIAGAIDSARGPFERRRDLPPRGQAEAHFGGTRELTFFEHEEIGAEELREVLRGSRDREIDRVG